jgi:HD-GYP domain-containing protein (c-di-GMP phosphodiesterase class II)
MKIDRALRVRKLIIIGQISSSFGLLILLLRHYLLYPANHHLILILILLIGFLPSLVYRFFSIRFAPYILIANALILVSLIFSLLQEWALAGVFLLVPVFSLLFQDRIIYLITSILSLALNIILALVFLYDADQASLQFVILLDVLTVFMVLVFIIYFVVKDLRGHYMAEARHLQTITTLSQSVDARDPYTKDHSERVAYIGQLIAENFPQLKPKNVYYSGLIHDVGKLSISDTILLKADKLTDEEYEIMKTHTTIGAKLCENLNISEEIILGVLHHHERWDGRGYPKGLKGEDIPLIGRILCVADAIDAMSSNRAYRDALNHDSVLREVENCTNSQFDPSIVQVVKNNWRRITAHYRY